MRYNFDLADLNGDGYLSREEVAMLFRAMGQTVSDAKIKAAVAELPDLSDFSTFKLFFAKHYTEPASPEAVEKAFSVFDPLKTGKISVSKFRDLVTSLANSLTHAEVDEVLKIAGAESKTEINYKEFARILSLGPS